MKDLKMKIPNIALVQVPALVEAAPKASPTHLYEIPHLAMRMVTERTLRVTREEVSTASDAVALAMPLIGDMPTEHLLGILLDGRGHVTGIVTLAQGGAHGVGVKVADVLRAVLAGHAAGFILAHNHPSDDPTPSREDVAFTQRVARGSYEVSLPLLDHVIVTRSGGFRSVPFVIPEPQEGA